MKVAIITRTKDRSLFLERAIESVACQTYKDYVHVIVNDGGDQKELEAVVSLFDESVRDNIKIFYRKLSSNAPDTIFNESIDRVDSEYVAIHDSDDTWHPEFLERTVALLEKGQEGVLVRVDHVTESVTSGVIKKVKAVAYMPDLVAVSLYRQLIDNQLTPIAFIYRRSAYEFVGKYDASLPVVGDWEFGIRFLKAYDVEYLDPGFPLANYHHRKGNTDSSFASNNHRKYVTNVINKYLRTEMLNGSLGAGYIMADLKYRQDVRHKIIKSLIPRPLLGLIRRRRS